MQLLHTAVRTIAMSHSQAPSSLTPQSDPPSLQYLLIIHTHTAVISAETLVTDQLVVRAGEILMERWSKKEWPRRKLGRNEPQW